VNGVICGVIGAERSTTDPARFIPGAARPSAARDQSPTEDSNSVKARSVAQLQSRNPVRWLQLGLLFMLIILQYRWWLGENSWVDVNRLENDIAVQETINTERRARNEALAARVADLKSGLDAVEELGRSDLGLVKPGEIFYVIPVE